MIREINSEAPSKVFVAKSMVAASPASSLSPAQSDGKADMISISSQGRELAGQAGAASSNDAAGGASYPTYSKPPAKPQQGNAAGSSSDVLSLMMALAGSLAADSGAAASAGDSSAAVPAEEAGEQGDLNSQQDKGEERSEGSV